ncbi:unnamed protein product [Bursaphelenchus xylophilus]|uniref:(pine wood nematode) hypothetical protein n=1 Tax=Bursaphelenchus xylophilus TaxID=6326 RepID=A0A7I8WLW0_BURXY|nr:unnamed protein product [Bursaphelenchus xylophilus]CAG9104873.1 unnamed protein product [Bursaphelenchus xylophilus]
MYMRSENRESHSFHTAIETMGAHDEEGALKEAVESLSQLILTAQSASLLNVGRKKNATLFTQKTQRDRSTLSDQSAQRSSKSKDEEEKDRLDLMSCNEILERFRIGSKSPNGGSKYLALKKIAAGGFSSVFVGHPKGSPGTAVAIKRVNIDKDEGLKEQLVFEAELLDRLGKNKYTVELMNAETMENDLFLVLELGTEAFIDFLCRYQKDRSYIEHKFIRKYFRQMVRACEFIHFQEIVHCDIKGDNFIRMPSGRLKLVDFGCAVLLGAMNEGVYRKRKLGTKHYMSPEYVKRAYASRALDVWSLGCILYDIIHERTPFDSEKDVKTAILEKEPDISLVSDDDMAHVLSLTFERDHKERVSCRQLTQERYFSRSEDPESGILIVRNVEHHSSKTRLLSCKYDTGIES